MGLDVPLPVIERDMAVFPRFRIPLATLGLASALFLSASASSAAPPPQSADDPSMKEAMDWLDSLGLPELKGTQFARFQLYGGSADKKQHYYSYGFVLDQTKDRMKVFPTGLGRMFPEDLSNSYEWMTGGAFEITAYGTHSDNKELTIPYTNYEPLDLEVAANALLADIDRMIAQKTENRTRLDQRAAIFIFAWGCHRNGLDAMAARIVAQARRLPGRFGEKNPATTPWRRIVSEEMSRTLTNGAIDLYCAMWTTRSQFLAQLEDIQKKFPVNPRKDEINRMIASLRKMIAQDALLAEHPAATTNLSDEQKVAELLRQLCDRTSEGATSGQPIILPAEKDSPQEQLRKMGEKAEPYLKQAEDDDRLTRFAYEGGNYRAEMWPMTLGRCVDFIRNMISRDAADAALSTDHGKQNQ